jgi:hypothetical protein
MVVQPLYIPVATPAIFTLDQAIRFNTPFPGPETPENRQNLPLDIVAPFLQHRIMVSETNEQFSLTRAALSACAAPKQRIPIRSTQ